MILRILDEATAEFADAIAYYEDIESGLGVRYRLEVQAATAWIGNNPELPNLRSLRMHQLVADRYKENPAEVVRFGLMNLKRWQQNGVDCDDFVTWEEVLRLPRIVFPKFSALPMKTPSACASRLPSRVSSRKNPGNRSSPPPDEYRATAAYPARGGPHYR